MSRKPDFVARLTYRSAEQSGRKHPAISGYRPIIKFEFSEKYTSGQQKFIDKEVVNPGETVLAEITITSPQFFGRCLAEGMTFIFCESPKNIIGTGIIIEILNQSLIKLGN